MLRYHFISTGVVRCHGQLQCITMIRYLVLHHHHDCLYVWVPMSIYLIKGFLYFWWPSTLWTMMPFWLVFPDAICKVRWIISILISSILVVILLKLLTPPSIHSVFTTNTTIQKHQFMLCVLGVMSSSPMHTYVIPEETVSWLRHIRPQRNFSFENFKHFICHRFAQSYFHGDRLLIQVEWNQWFKYLLYSSW